MVEAQRKNVPVRVKFDNNGFYHPSYGKMGKGRNLGVIYTLPSFFRDEETISVEHRDPKTQAVSIKKVTRRKHLPASAQIIDEEQLQELREVAQDTGGEAPRVAKPDPSNAEDFKARSAKAAAKKSSASKGRVIRED